MFIFKHLDGLAVIAGEGEAIFNMGYPEWFNGDKEEEIIAQLKLPPDQEPDFEKTCIEALRNHIRRGWK